MKILSKLFGGAARVKIMRLFLFNPDAAFDADLVAEKSAVSPAMARKECAFLRGIGLVRQKTFVKTVERRVRGKRIARTVKTHGYQHDPRFPHAAALRQLLISTKTLGGGEILRRLAKAGRLQLVVMAGVFIQHPESRLDLMVVGDRLNRRAIETAVHSLEAEIGRDLLYACFETPDFAYRLGMYDKLIRDVLDYPHEKLLNKILE